MSVDRIVVGVRWALTAAVLAEVGAGVPGALGVLLDDSVRLVAAHAHRVGELLAALHEIARDEIEGDDGKLLTEGEGEVVALLAIGRAAQPDKPYTGRFPVERIVFAERFGEPWRDK